MSVAKQSDSFAILNAVVEPVSGPRLERGCVLVQGGRIAKVAKSLHLPASMARVDAKGKLLTPGLMDAHSHAGLIEDGMPGDDDFNEINDPLTPQVKAIDAFKPTDAQLLEAAQSGVTSLFVTPGSANVIGGMGSVVKTLSPTFASQIVKLDAGLKMAMGENPKRVYGELKKAPTTRMGTAAVLRAALTRAVIYGQKKRLHRSTGKKDPFETDLGNEALLGMLEGKYPGRCHAHRSIDMLTALRVADEFKIRLVFEHATECEDILEELVRRQIPVVIGPSFIFRSKIELQHRNFGAVAAAVKAGLVVAITADTHVTPLRYMNVYAALAMREGLAWQDALKALTLNPAIICGVDARLGSIEPGKDADLVLWQGDPFDARTRPEAVWISGRPVDLDIKSIKPRC